MFILIIFASENSTSTKTEWLFVHEFASVKVYVISIFACMPAMSGRNVESSAVTPIPENIPFAGVPESTSGVSLVL